MTPNWNPPPKDDQHENVKLTSKLFLSAIALTFVVYLITLLPGSDQIVPLTPLPFAAIVTAIVTVVIVGALVMAASSIASIIHAAIAGSGSPHDIAENAASVAYWLVILTAITLAHRGLADVIRPFLDGLFWTYDVAFLLLSIPVCVVIAVRLFAAIDPSAELLANSIVGEPNRNTSERSHTTDQTDVNGSQGGSS